MKTCQRKKKLKLFLCYSDNEDAIESESEVTLTNVTTSKHETLEKNGPDSDEETKVANDEIASEERVHYDKMVREMQTEGVESRFISLIFIS